MALCNIQKDISRLDPCTHEEADTRIILHLEDAVKEGNTKFSTRTVDTDVVVLALTSVQRLKNAEIWVDFAVGKSIRFLAAHEMARTLGHDRCMALPMFHAFTGCDTVSCFAGRGKRSAWDTRKVYDDVTPALCSLIANPEFIKCDEDIGAICGINLRSHQHPAMYPSGPKAALHTEKKSNRKASSDKRSSHTAHKACSLSNRLLLGPSNDPRPKDSISE